MLTHTFFTVCDFGLSLGSGADRLDRRNRQFFLLLNRVSLPGSQARKAEWTGRRFLHRTLPPLRLAPFLPVDNRGDADILRRHRRADHAAAGPCQRGESD